MTSCVETVCDRSFRHRLHYRLCETIKRPLRSLNAPRSIALLGCPVEEYVSASTGIWNQLRNTSKLEGDHGTLRYKTKKNPENRKVKRNSVSHELCYEDLPNKGRITFTQCFL